MKSSWKMTGHPSLVTCKIDMHVFSSQHLCTPNYWRGKGEGPGTNKSKQISVLLFINHLPHIFKQITSGTLFSFSVITRSTLALYIFVTAQDSKVLGHYDKGSKVGGVWTTKARWGVNDRGSRWISILWYQESLGHVNWFSLAKIKLCSNYTSICQFAGSKAGSWNAYQVHCKIYGYLNIFILIKARN